MQPRSTAFLLALLLAAGGCASSEEQRVFETRRDSAKLYYDQGDLNRAAALVRGALEINPNDPLCLAILGMTRARQANVGGSFDPRLLDGAIQTFDQAEDNGGRNLFQVQLGHGLARATRAAGFLRRAEAAEERIEALLGGPDSAERTAPATSDPTVIDALANLRAEAKKARESAAADLAIAADRLDAAHDAQPDRADVLEQLQALHSMRGEPEESMRYGRRVVEMTLDARKERLRMLDRVGLSVATDPAARREMRLFDSREANSRGLIALMLYRQGKFAEAATELDRVLELDPDRIDDYYNRGVCRQETGRFRDAASDFEDFVKRSTLPIDSKQMREVWDRLALCREKAKASDVGVSAR